MKSTLVASVAVFALLCPLPGAKGQFGGLSNPLGGGSPGSGNAPQSGVTSALNGVTGGLLANTPSTGSNTAQPPNPLGNIVSGATGLLGTPPGAGSTNGAITPSSGGNAISAITGLLGAPTGGGSTNGALSPNAVGNVVSAITGLLGTPTGGLPPNSGISGITLPPAGGIALTPVNLPLNLAPTNLPIPQANPPSQPAQPAVAPQGPNSPQQSPAAAPQQVKSTPAAAPAIPSPTLPALSPSPAVVTTSPSPVAAPSPSIPSPSPSPPSSPSPSPSPVIPSGPTRRYEEVVQNPSGPGTPGILDVGMMCYGLPGGDLLPFPKSTPTSVDKSQVICQALVYVLPGLTLQGCNYVNGSATGPGSKSNSTLIVIVPHFLLTKPTNLTMKAFADAVFFAVDGDPLGFQAALTRAAKALGYTLSFTTQADVVTPPAASPPPPPAACHRKFGHWCIDGSSLDKADIAGIIVGGCIFVILLIALVGFLVISAARKRKPPQESTLSDEPLQQTGQTGPYFTPQDASPRASHDPALAPTTGPAPTPAPEVPPPAPEADPEQAVKPDDKRASDQIALSASSAAAAPQPRPRGWRGFFGDRMGVFWGPSSNRPTRTSGASDRPSDRVSQGGVGGTQQWMARMGSFEG